MGLDAFALNVEDATDSWATAAIAQMFSTCAGTPLKLFFSFDMTHFTDPSTFLFLIEQYYQNDAYYKFNGLPVVSTFNGGASAYTFGEDNVSDGWDIHLKKALSFDIFFMPDFDDAPNYPNSFFDTFPVVDGALGWEAAWPEIGQGLTNVSDTVDQVMVSSAKAASKAYIMRRSSPDYLYIITKIVTKLPPQALSSLQFKHLDSSDNWYRIGESNLPQRMSQVLALQPAFIEILTWNDWGESHYIGEFYEDATFGSVETGYDTGCNHTAWQSVLGPFITAFKSNATAVSSIVPPDGVPAIGAMWYRTILTTATCASDPLGKPDGWENALDAVSFAVLLPDGTAGITIKVMSGGKLIGSFAGTAGLNYATVEGMVAGAQSVEVVDGSGAVVISASSTSDVLAEAGAVCNYNYNVVKIANTATTATATSAKSTTTTTATSTSSCATATSVAVTLDEIVTTVNGQTIKIAGDIDALGNWDTSKGVALSASDYTISNPVWDKTISLAAGTVIQYKYINVASNGDVTWEADPNHTYTVPSTCATAVTVSNAWQS
jgi:glucan endo-1,3-alpha-glucosidase